VADVGWIDISPVAWLGSAGTALLSAGLVALAIAYARRRGLLDEPGRRRSHRMPTPRGGGIGIVGAMLVALAVLAAWRPSLVDTGTAMGLAFGLAVTAAIGWYDDHRPLRAWPRLLAHGIAATGFVVALSGTSPPSLPAFGAPVAWWMPVVALVMVASINLHNFMDGIDGLLALQALFVFGVFTACGALAGAYAWALSCALVASAVAGFLPFNFPRARIFMGDVGSGAVGFVIAALAALGILRGHLDLVAALLAVSAFAIDAGLTLFSRIVRGRRWYSAHREHLYQWLVRGGRSHAKVAGLYMAWNLSVVVPALIAAASLPPPAGWFLCAVVYAIGALAWCTARRACLAHARARGGIRALA
jgi:UDP-N-acetylmuramyl pentapeptide phosphotransferase/UDP-N-acetylglucosamine-1-phosphate transferase